MYYASFALSMLAPLSLFIIGLIWRSNPPKNRNAMFSYRTELSLKNDDTWAFSHHHIAKLWVRIGIIAMSITVFLMVYLKDIYGSLLLWILAGQMIFLCATVFFVDALMKAIFDENGNRT